MILVVNYLDSAVIICIAVSILILADTNQSWLYLLQMLKALNHKNDKFNLYNDENSSKYFDQRIAE
ncbi:hypothetical protein DT74_06515 [Acinetobacter sp. ETR1]|nr:hypothetical protein DT74_06515 [Acinetobacter sp. ETR1]